MINDYEKARRDIVRVKQMLDKKDLGGLNQETAEEYFANLRQIFTHLAHRIKSAKTDAERKTLIGEMVELNGLYGIQLILNFDLPPDLEEIAYDYDHDEFPGYEHRIDSILNDKYILLGGKGKASSWRASGNRQE